MTVRVALVQVEVREDLPLEQRRENTRRTLAGIDADLILLPELWDVGAFAVQDAADLAEPIDGDWVRAMSTAGAGRVVHAGSFLERDGDRLFNTSVVFGPDGSVRGTYRKIHLFGFEGGEASVLSAGDARSVVPTPLGPAGLATCYDLRFPELFRGYVDSGAQTMLVPSGWPTARIARWRLLAAARAAENQMWFLGANATGSSAGTPLGGRSLIADPWGNVVAEADVGPTVLFADLDPEYPGAVRRSFPVLEDRRL